MNLDSTVEVALISVHESGDSDRVDIISPRLQDYLRQRLGSLSQDQNSALGKVKAAVMTRAWAQHLMFLVVEALQWTSHMGAKVAKGDDVTGRADTIVGGHAKLDQEI